MPPASMMNYFLSRRLKTYVWVVCCLFSCSVFRFNSISQTQAMLATASPFLFAVSGLNMLKVTFQAEYVFKGVVSINCWLVIMLLGNKWLLLWGLRRIVQYFLIAVYWDVHGCGFWNAFELLDYYWTIITTTGTTAPYYNFSLVIVVVNVKPISVFRQFKFICLVTAKSVLTCME